MSMVTSICGNATRCGRDAAEVERGEHHVVRGDLALALVHHYASRRLVVVGVVKISDLLVGIVVLRSMSLVKIPPLVSMPSENAGQRREAGCP